MTHASSHPLFGSENHFKKVHPKYARGKNKSWSLFDHWTNLDPHFTCLGQKVWKFWKQMRFSVTEHVSSKIMVMWQTDWIVAGKHHFSQKLPTFQVIKRHFRDFLSISLVCTSFTDCCLTTLRPNFSNKQRDNLSPVSTNKNLVMKLGP